VANLQLYPRITYNLKINKADKGEFLALGSLNNKVLRQGERWANAPTRVVL
jgi:hypothetical protein